jgi:hypothetical protein
LATAEGAEAPELIPNPADDHRETGWENQETEDGSVHALTIRRTGPDLRVRREPRDLRRFFRSSFKSESRTRKAALADGLLLPQGLTQTIIDVDNDIWWQIVAPEGEQPTHAWSVDLRLL